MFLDYMSTCGAASDWVHVGLQVNPGGLGEHFPSVWMGSSTLCLSKTFYVCMLSLHMTFAQQAELLEHFSRKAHWCLAQVKMECENLSSDRGPESGLHTLDWIYLVIQTSGVGWSFPPCPRCPGCPWVGWAQPSALCFLCSLPPPPKTEAGGEQMTPFPHGGVSHRHLAWTGVVSQKPLETEQPGRNLLPHTAAIA